MNNGKYYSGRVAIAADRPLEQVAEAVNSVLDGFTLREEDTGRFEGVPGFIDQRGPIEVRLTGIPEGEQEDDDYYILALNCRQEIEPIPIGQEICSKFVAAFPSNLPVRHTGSINLCEHLLAHLQAHTSLNCWLFDGWLS